MSTGGGGYFASANRGSAGRSYGGEFGGRGGNFTDSTDPTISPNTNYGGNGGSGGAGGTIVFGSKYPISDTDELDFSSIHAYNGSYKTDSSSAAQEWNTAYQTGIYAQLGYNIQTMRNSGVTAAYWNDDNKTYSFSGGTADNTLVATTVLGLGVGSGAGYTESSNGTVTEGAIVKFDWNGVNWQTDDVDGVDADTKFRHKGYYSCAPQAVTIGGYAKEPTKIQQYGYEVVSWHVDDPTCSDDTKWDFGQQVGGDMTLYAKWELVKYKLTYHPNGTNNRPVSGEVPVDNNDYSVWTVPEFTAKIEENDSLERVGYTFEGWNLEPDGSGDSYEAGQVIKLEKDTVLYAEWDVVRCLVQFDMNEGHREDEVIASVPKPTLLTQRVQYDKTVEWPGNPSHLGWVFTGWYTEKECKNRVDFDERITESKVYYAGWVKSLPAVRFDTNGVSCNDAEYTKDEVLGTYYKTVQVGDVGNKVDMPVEPTPTDPSLYEFAGWYTSPECTDDTKYDFNTAVNASVVLYAKWSVTLNYDLRGMEVSNAEKFAGTTASTGRKLTKPEDPKPTKEGYVFGGWYHDSGCVEPWDFEKDTVGSAVTLYAKWDVTVTFDWQMEDEEKPTMTASVGQAIAEPNTRPDRAGYIFMGWYKEPSCINEWIFGDNTVEGIMTLYARWDRKLVTVEYNGNGAAGNAPEEKKTVEADTTHTLPQNTYITPDGTEFKGWTLSPSPSGGDTYYKPNDTCKLLTNTTFYAQWGDITYHVIYDANNDGDPITGVVPTDSMGYDYGDRPIVRGQGSMARTGYSFVGWATTTTATEAEYWEGKRLEALTGGDVTLYAVWEKEVYSVTYYDTGATGGDAPEDENEYTLGQCPTVRDNPATGGLVKTDYTFKGWVDEAGNTYAGGDSLPPMTGDVKLRPIWEAVVWTVTYLDTGADSGEVKVDTTTYSAEQPTVVVKENPGELTRKGYTLVGWTKDGTATYKAGNTLGLSGSVYLSPVWEAEEVRIVYEMGDAEGGTPPVETNTYYFDGTNALTLGNDGQKDGEADPLTKTGKKLVGWSTQLGGGIEYGIGAPLTLNETEIKLYPIWDDALYRVTYDGNGADGILAGESAPLDNQRYIYGQTVTLKSNTYTKTGAWFKGWNTKADGTGTALSASHVITGNTTLYAIWEKGNYTVTYLAPDATSGTVPVDEKQYRHGDTAKVKGNVGVDADGAEDMLEKTNFTFAGWNTSPDGTGTQYPAGEGFVMVGNMELYATWSNLLYVDLSLPSTPEMFSADQKEYTAETDADTETVYLRVGYSTSSGIYYAIDPEEPEEGAEDTTEYIALESEKWAAIELNPPGSDTVVRVYALDAKGNPVEYTYTITRKPRKSTGGGSGVSYYSVVYLAGAGGSVPAGQEAEQIRSGGYPTVVPSVTVKPAYTFLGWSLDGKTTVDPTTVQVKKNLTFSALYDVDEELLEKLEGVDPNAIHTWYMQGYADSTFRPQDPLLRSEITAIFARLLSDYAPAESTFYDIDPDAWYADYVGFAQKKGLIHGRPDGSYCPDDPITRGEFVTVMCNYLGLPSVGIAGFPDTDGHWAEGAIYQLARLGILSGYPNGQFQPDAYITRAEAVKIFNGVFRRSPNLDIPTEKKDYSNPFYDLAETHWAYEEIMETIKTHTWKQYHQEN